MRESTNTSKCAEVRGQICWLPVLSVLARTLVRELDTLTATRARYREIRREYAGDEPIPHQTPYDHVIDRLENALNDVYDHIDAIETANATRRQDYDLLLRVLAANN